MAAPVTTALGLLRVTQFVALASSEIILRAAGIRSVEEDATVGRVIVLYEDNRTFTLEGTVDQYEAVLEEDDDNVFWERCVASTLAGLAERHRLDGERRNDQGQALQRITDAAKALADQATTERRARMGGAS